jgi:hypothetical protein
MFVFKVCLKRQIFDTPFHLFKEKKLSSHCRVNVYFYKLKSPIWKQSLNISENEFFINRSEIFIALPKFYVRHLGVKSTGPLWVSLTLFLLASSTAYPPPLTNRLSFPSLLYLYSEQPFFH